MTIESLPIGESDEFRLVMLASADRSTLGQEAIAHLVALSQADLDWSNVFILSLWHKTAFVVLESLKLLGCIDLALQSGRLSLLLLNHWKQLAAVNAMRNQVHANAARLIQAEMTSVGVAAPLSKGGLLLCPTCYSLKERKMYDLDFLCNRSNFKEVMNVMTRLGCIQGHYRHDIGKIVPMTQHEFRSWMLHSRGLPNFLMPVESPVMDYAVVQFQGAIGSTEMGMSRDVAPLIESAVMHDCYYAVSPVDLLIQLCLHLYRETSEESFRLWNMDNNLIKYADLSRFAAAFFANHGQSGVHAFCLRSKVLKLGDCVIVGLYHAQAIYPNAALNELVNTLRSSFAHITVNPGEVLQGVRRVGAVARLGKPAWNSLVGSKTF